MPQTPGAMTFLDDGNSTQVHRLRKTGFEDFKNNQIELVLGLDNAVIDKLKLKQFNQNQSPVAIHICSNIDCSVNHV